MPNQGVLAVLGPNGSGKTTLIKCILGMVLPDKGDILHQGASVLGRHAYRNDISYIAQAARFPAQLTSLELIHMIKDLRPGETRESTLIDLLNLSDELEKPMSKLSGGNHQKINLLLGLMYDSPLLIMDEPSTGLDPLSLQNLKSFIRQERDRGKLIIITTHIMSLVEEIAEFVLFLLDGQIYFQGRLHELLLQEKEDRLEPAIANILSHDENMQHA